METTMPLTVLEAHWLTPSFLCTHHLLHPQHYLYCQLFPFTLIIIVVIVHNHEFMIVTKAMIITSKQNLLTRYGGDVHIDDDENWSVNSTRGVSGR